MTTSSSSEQPWEVEDIFKAINGVIRELNKKDTFRAQRSVKFLEAIKATIRAFCTCQTQDGSYYEIPE